MARRVNTDVITFTWDVNLGLPQVLETSDGAQYVHGLDLIGEYRDGLWAYPLGDALGSVRQWTDEDGFVTYRGSYTPFGVALSSEGSTESAWGYTGELFDASLGDVYLRARWLDVSTGRFTRRDPWRGSLWQPGSMQGYGYVKGNPVGWVDPSGMVPAPPECEFGEICHGAPLGPYSPTGAGISASLLEPRSFGPPEGYWVPQLTRSVAVLFDIPGVRMVTEAGGEVAPSLIVGNLGVGCTRERHYAGGLGSQLLEAVDVCEATYGIGPDIDVASATVGGKINLATGEHTPRFEASLFCGAIEFQRDQFLAGVQWPIDMVIPIPGLGGSAMAGVEWGTEDWPARFWVVAPWSYYSGLGSTSDQVSDQFLRVNNIPPNARSEIIYDYYGNVYELASRLNGRVHVVGVYQ